MTKFISVLLVVLLLAACGGSKPVSDSKITPEYPQTGPSDEQLVKRRCTLPVAGSWDSFHGDATRRGNAPGPAMSDPKIAWSTRIGIQGASNNPIVVDDWVYVGTRGEMDGASDASDGVYALSAVDGKIRWFQPTQADANAVAYSDCLVVSGADDGKLMALDAMTGEVVWQRAFLEARFVAQPLIMGRLVVFADTRGQVHALELGSGRTVWTAKLKSPVVGGIASNGGLVYVGTTTGVLAALDVHTGKIVWSHERDARIESAPTIVGSVVIQGFVDTKGRHGPYLAALDARSGEPFWLGSNPKGFLIGTGQVPGSVAIANNLAIFASPGSNRTVGISLDNGELMWSAISGSCMKRQAGSATVVGNTVLVPRQDGFLHAVETEKGVSIWSIWLGRNADKGVAPHPHRWSGCLDELDDGTAVDATPAVGADGSVYVGTREGYLYALRE